jgi:hypothetical protein
MVAFPFLARLDITFQARFLEVRIDSLYEPASALKRLARKKHSGLQRRRVSIVKGIQRMILLIAPALALAGPTVAQVQFRPQAETPQIPPIQPVLQRPLTPLKLQVVISRYENNSSNAKRINSIPYELAVTSNDPRAVNLKMMSQVPVPAGKDGAHTYLNVGTNITATASTTEDGSFRVEVTIEDSSILDRRSAEAQATTVPTLRSLQTTNSVVLRDRQSSQFIAATDKNNGEVVRVEVSLAVDR